MVSKFLILLAHSAQYLPKGKSSLALFFLRLASNNSRVPSIYGPLLQPRWHDKTFALCVSGKYYGTYLSNFLRRYSKPYSFVDIGANIGLYSLIAAHCDNCQSCYAFEPNPVVFKSMQQNIVLNNAKKIQAYNFAISDANDWQGFKATESHTGIGTLVAGNTDGAIKVRSMNREIFDKISSADRFPKIVKIDVEGHEPVVTNELINSSMWHDVHYLYIEADNSRFDVRLLSEILTNRGLTMVTRVDQGDEYNLMFKKFF